MVVAHTMHPLQVWLRTLGAAVCCCAISCGGGGRYGFSRTYSPLDAEEVAAEGARDYDPVMVRRLPHEWKGKPISLFGVVLSREEGTAGRADVELSVRRLAARNLCQSGADDSCRVTVSDHELGRVHAQLNLKEGDAVGKERVQPRSLVRIVGKLADGADAKDGEDVLIADYYRHWPPGIYVTEQAREFMRR